MLPKNLAVAINHLYKMICDIVKNGVTGVGAQGPPGPRGFKGDKGDQGIQGFQGIQGAQGQSIQPKGVISTVSSLPTLPDLLDAYITQDTSHLYIYDPNCGTCTPTIGHPGWVDMGELQGVPGIQGLQGPQGPPGTSGSSGNVNANRTTVTTLSTSNALISFPTVHESGDLFIVNGFGNTSYYYSNGITFTFAASYKNYEELTLTQLSTKISTASLIPNTLYKITGVHKNKTYNTTTVILYDDGTNSGITIYIRALSPTKLEEFGTGEFYVPNYKGIDTEANLDATGNHGILVNGNTYTTGDMVFYGGYAWTYNGGVIPTLTTTYDSFNLPTGIFTKLPFSNTTAYSKVFNTIAYNQDLDQITYRKDDYTMVEVDNRTYLGTAYTYNGQQRTPISAFGWHKLPLFTNNTLVLQPHTYGNVKIENSYVETVNFLRCSGCVFMRGTLLYGNIGKFSLFSSTFIASQLRTNNINGGITGGLFTRTTISSNIVTNVQLINITMNGGTFGSNTLSTVTGNTFTGVFNNAIVNNNTISNCNVTGLTFESDSRFIGNTISDSLVHSIVLQPLGKIENCVISSTSLFHSNIVHTNCVLTVTLNNSHFTDNTIDNTAVISNVTLTASSSISKCYIYSNFSNLTLTSSSSINNCYFYGTTDFSSQTITGKVMTLAAFKNNVTVPAIQTATIIFDNKYWKDIILDPTPKIAYIDGGVLLVNNITI